jgi:predicted amidohydrolase YtcJ
MNVSRRTRRILAALVVMALMTVIFVLTGRRHADLIYENGIIHTLDGSDRTVEALAVLDGRIIGLGTTEEFRSEFEADTRVDLAGRAVIPGFVDAHGRLLNAGLLTMTLDLSAAASVREAASMVAHRARAIPGGSWIRGRGWANAWWDVETAKPLAVLDEAAPENPVMLLGEDGAVAWVNTAALRAAGIRLSRTEHEPATVVRDRSGAPMGILLDDAAAAVQMAMPPPSDWELDAALDSAAAACLRAGITTIHDFGLTDRQIALYRSRAEQGTMPLRVYAVIGGAGAVWDSARTRGPVMGIADDMLTIAAIELYVDGALESHSAALMDPYDDQSSTRGMTLVDEREITRVVREALDGGFQVCLNTRGDRAVHIALEATADARRDGMSLDGSVRLDGVQLIDSADIARAKDMGVRVVMHPSQYLLDFDIARRRLGDGRMGRFMPWQEFFLRGMPVASGTDLPIGPGDPLEAIALVIARGEPSEYGERALRLSALRMFTTWAAGSGVGLSDRGSLEEGKLADFLVLSDDPFAVGRDRVAAIRVEQTILAGKVWRAAHH